MAFKFIVFSALLALASAGALHHANYAHVVNPAVDAVAQTHQNVVRTHEGTVSEYSKTIETPYSSVHKSDKRISNNVYTPVVAHISHGYVAPAVAKANAEHHVYQHHDAPQQVYVHQQEHEHNSAAAHYVHAAAPVAKTVAYTAPAVAKSVSYATPAPVHVYHHEVPVNSKVVKYEAAAPLYHHHDVPVAYNHGQAASTYAHNSPAHGSSHSVHYSPAEMVSHISFDGFGTHWGY